MKKIIYLLILSILFIPITANASTVTYPRTRENLGVNSWVELDEDTIVNIMNTPNVDENEKIYDFAHLLSENEESELYNTIKEAIHKTNLDIIIVTISENNKESAQHYADDFYNFNNFGENKSRDGILFLIDMDNRVSWFTTTGQGIIFFDDYRITAIENSVYDYLTKAEYYEASSTFIEEVENYVDEGVPSSNEDYEIDENGNLVKKKEINWILSFAASFIVSIIVLWILISKHKMIKPAIYANDYLNRNNVVLYTPIDRFITTHTTMIRINRDSNRRIGGGGGGSSTHRSSGGGFNGGGGGRRF